MHLGTCKRQRNTISNERASTNWQASYKLRSNIWRTEAHGARKSAREEESILKKLTRKQDVPTQKRKAKSTPDASEREAELTIEAPRPEAFDRQKHSLLNEELKMLYTAITRARVKVLAC